ncbi:phage-like head protein [Peptoclostridium acidaminophilum DSM 3953]|uniref:Phage-like head protein n=1 Tax=Peptoclostridium acidaminophilum DSM 3953 TaxID=1286171 RepID=W8T3R0_PEPAC|nr:phage major capsid protein [Peptoclostridium acidaminophilum]AHM56404.1 phage-like head protein [Peptoclostridium acidaminophilum DSM 3953]
MNKELRELLARINAKKESGLQLVNEKKLDEAEKVASEVKDMEREFEIKLQLFEDEKKQIPGINDDAQKMDEVKAFMAALRGKATPEILDALVTSTDADGGYLVPKDITTRINELKRQYKSAKDLVGIYPTSTKSGTLVYEDLSTLTDLVDFDESGTDLDSSSQPKFASKTYAVKNYGAVLPISNVLLQDEQADLVGYVGGWFARKAVRTENTKIFAALKAGVSATAIADYKALKKSINIGLDPLIAENAIIITNQDGFDYLDSELDATSGRPILQPDPTNPTVKKFMGKPVYVFSNAELPTTGTTTKKAPIIFGALTEAVKFVDRGVYEMVTSTEAGFTKNQTFVRCIERFDVLVADAGAYVYGEITTVAGA